MLLLFRRQFVVFFRSLQVSFKSFRRLEKNSSSLSDVQMCQTMSNVLQLRLLLWHHVSSPFSLKKSSPSPSQGVAGPLLAA